MSGTYKIKNFRGDYVSFDVEDGVPSSMQLQNYLTDTGNEGRLNLRNGPPKAESETVELPVVMPNPFGVPYTPLFAPTVEHQVDKVAENKKIEKEWLSVNVPKALQINPSEFDVNGEVKGEVRNLASFLTNPALKKEFLRKEYGYNNVESYNVGGKTTFYVRPEGNKWIPFDSPDLNVHDFTADGQGGFFPFMANIGTTIATFKATTAASGGNVFLGGYLAGTAGNAAEATTGMVQDQLMAEALGVDIPFAQSFAERGTDFLINQAIDTFLFGASKALPHLRYGQQFNNQFATDATIFYRQMHGDQARVPLVYQRGTTGSQIGGKLDMERLRRIGTVFPNSAAAKTLNEGRVFASQGTRDAFGNTRMSENQIDVVIREANETMLEMAQKDLDSAKQIVKNALEQKTAIEGSINDIPNRVLQQAEEAYDTAVQKRLNFLNTRGSKPPNKQGVEIIDFNRNRYVQVEATRTKMFDKVYKKFDNLEEITVEDVLTAFRTIDADAAKIGQDAIKSDLLTNTEKYANSTIRNLDELGEEKITFRQLNRILQQIEVQAKRSKVGQQEGGPTKTQLISIANQLRSLRDDIVNSDQVSDATRNEFKKANEYFQNVVLPYRERPTFSRFYTPEGGASYNSAIQKNVAGEQYNLPALDGGGAGAELLNYALSSVKNLNIVLADAGNSPEVRKGLADAWLRANGLSSGQPINVKTLSNLNDEALEIAQILFPGRGKAEFSQKVQAIIDLNNLVKDKDGFIAGVSPDLHKKIMNNQDPKQQDKLLKLAQEEIEAQNKIDEVTKSVLVKLQANGEVPVFNNNFTVESFMGSLMKDGVKIKDFNLLVEQLKKNPEALAAYRRGLDNFLINKSGGGSQVSENAQKINGVYSYDPILFKNNLLDYKEKIIALTSPSHYDKMVRMTDAKIAHSEIDVEAAGRLGMAGSPKTGGGTIFFSDLNNVAHERFSQLMLSLDLRNFNPSKKLIPKEDLFILQNKLFLYSHLGMKSMTELHEVMDADPLFRSNVTDSYTGIAEETSQAVMRLNGMLDEIGELSIKKSPMLVE